MESTVHTPILVEPIVNALLEPFETLPENSPANWIVDCTLGGGGHTAAFLQALHSNPRLGRHRVLSVDRDPSAIRRAEQRFRDEIAKGWLQIVHAPFSELEALIQDKPVLAMMADLGFSSDQMDDPSRGFSFMSSGPLDMRMDPTRGLSCYEFLKQVRQIELERILKDYGEERFNRRIASAIIENRTSGRLPTTPADLAQLVVRAIPPPARKGRIHAATRTFQALRIAVNDELEELECLLKRVILSVKPGGRIAILSFHSLEDRRVKHTFREGPFEQTTKKPIEPTEEEIRMNPRARSAKLRIAVKKGD